MKTTLVNEDKLYSVIGKFFTDGSNLLLELIQNAQRANAGRVSVQLPYLGEHPFGSDAKPENLLRIEDDGRGIHDIRALLGIAISDWGAGVEAQDPAGMGFLQLLALSRQVDIRSCFGGLRIDSQRFLHDSGYRGRTLRRIDPQAALENGTVILADMQKPWTSYLRSDMSWYSGHDGFKLTINGQEVQPIRVRDLIDEADKRKNPYTVLSHLQNTLFIEIGNLEAIVGSCRSAVNWYGQLIPVYSGTCAASHCNIRFYYDVKKGTPLTPRYPDRTSLNLDDRYDGFMAFLNQAVLALLRKYFDAFPASAKFTSYINSSLLSHYYEHADESDLEGMDLVPVTDDAFSSSAIFGGTIARKQELRDTGACFHVGDIRVDDEYSLGADTGELRCYGVSDKVANQLRKFSIPELVDVNTAVKPKELINVADLMLELTYADGKLALLPLRNAMLMDDYGDVYIYAESEASVETVAEEMLEKVYNTQWDKTFDETWDDLRYQIEECLAAQYSVIDTRHFGFIPRHYDIRQIRFERGNLAVAYNDGSSREFVIRGG
jgi:hypothetical protein